MLFKSKKKNKMPTGDYNKSDNKPHNDSANKENQEEQRATESYMKRAHSTWKSLGMYTAHKTNFNVKEAMAILVIWLALGRVFGFLFSKPYYWITGHLISQSIPKPALLALTFLVVEILPTLVTMFLVFNRKHLLLRMIPTKSKLKKEYRIKHHTVHIDYQEVEDQHASIKNHHQKLIDQTPWVFWTPLKRWIKIFWHDLVDHKALILVLLLMLDVIDIISTFVFQAIDPQPNLASPNTENIMTMAKECWPIFFIVIFVSPVVEELIFRCLIPKIFYTGLNVVVARGKFMEWKYWFSAFFAALIFASLHETTVHDFPLIASYVVFGLVQQFIRKKSDSLTLPIFTHASSNLIAVLLGLV